MFQSYPLPVNEKDRLDALAEFDIMDSAPEADFDRLATLASHLFEVPIVLVSLIGDDRQFFKARIGLNVCETSREVSFCAHAIMQDDALIVPDALKDPRFSVNPLVLGPPFIRFYAGMPLVAAKGEKIGTVCLIDTKPRSDFSDKDRRNLKELTALVADQMEMRRLNRVRSISQARFENIAATSPDAIICSNSNGKITFWNQSAQRLFNYMASEIVGHSGDIIVPDSWRPIYDAELSRLRRGLRLELADQTIELSGRRKDGSEFPAEFSLSTWREGDSVSVGAIVRDVSERRQNEERLLRLATIDSLTDIPNRNAWRECLGAKLTLEEPLTMLLLDLDGFKEVNDTHGHTAGDIVLKEVAGRLNVICGEALIIARLGGDEFAALLPGNGPAQAKAIASRVAEAIMEPYEYGGRMMNIGASIGIALAPQHGVYPEELLGAADLALYRAKAAGKGCNEVFTPSLREAAVARRGFQLELRQAFERQEFELFYQPQFSVFDRKLTGAEALIRWNHPERGLLTPASFIEVLSQKPSAGAVGEWVLLTACQQAAKWRSVVPEFKMGINLFDAQFRSGRLLAIIREALQETGLPPQAVELEIVENILLQDDAATLKLLQDIRKMDVGLAFDDYGTGFASLSLLKKYPVSRLKIDRSFIRDVNSDTEDAAVVRAILYLAQSFRMDVIAEGVETEAQLDFLRMHNCPQAQGYLVGKPVPAEEFEARFLTFERLSKS